MFPIFPGILLDFTQVPVIALSASTDCGDRALLLGVSDFIQKPLDPDEMVGRIKAVLQAGD